jgi:hypothetical protein
VENVSHQRLEVSDAKVLIRCNRLNGDKDKTLEHITGKKAKPLNWYAMEATDRMLTGILDAAPFAREFEYPPQDVNVEPLGMSFLRYANWNVVERNLYCQVVSPEEAQEVVQTSCHPMPDPPSNAGDDRSAALETTTPTSVGFSSGATVWNRKEGGMTLAPPHRQVLKEPLTAWQVETFVSLLVQLQRTLPQSVQSIVAYTDKIVGAWNDMHTRSLVQTGTGLGGLMTVEIARNRVRQLANDAARDRLDRSVTSRANLLIAPVEIVHTATAFPKSGFGFTATPAQSSPILPWTVHSPPPGVGTVPAMELPWGLPGFALPLANAPLAQQRAISIAPRPANIDAAASHAVTQHSNIVALRRPVAGKQELKPFMLLQLEEVKLLSRSNGREYATLLGLKKPNLLADLRALLVAKWMELKGWPANTAEI